MVRAPPCHGGGRGFESHPGRMRSDCKSSHFSGRIEDFSGNSLRSKFFKLIPKEFTYGILAQLGEHLPYKQRVIGSSPIGPTQWLIDYRLAVKKCADMAQLAEQLICNQQVNGSSPFIGLCHLGVDPARVHGPLAQLVRATGS